MSYGIGLDLGGTSVKAVAVDGSGTLLDSHRLDFDPAVPRDWAVKVRAAVDYLAARRGGRSAWAGLSAPGLASADERSIAYMPGRLHGLEGLDWSAYLDLGHPVPVLNDAQAALLGEIWVGAGRGLRNAILLTLGTGVGGAAMVDGHLLRGHIGRAGHLGHLSLDPDGPADVCNTPGSVEYAIGNYSIGERTGGRFPTTHALVQAVQAGDPDAARMWAWSVKRLAAAVASYINILDPETVIIGGGVAKAGPLLFDPLARHLDAMEWRPGGHRARLVPAILGEFAGAFGAARNGLERAA